MYAHTFSINIIQNNRLTLLIIYENFLYYIINIDIFFTIRLNVSFVVQYLQ